VGCLSMSGTYGVTRGIPHWTDESAGDKSDAAESETRRRVAWRL